MEAKVSPFKAKYENEIVPKLQEHFKYKNKMMIPKVTKVVVNMGLGEAIQNNKILQAGVEQLGIITGQKAVIRKSRHNISQFKLRKGMNVGASVTLRGDMMYDFLYRLICIALPRVRDFRGVSKTAFDGRGNYTLGLKEQIIFPEIDYDTIEKVKGLNVTVVTTAPNDEEALEMLKLFGMPFRK